LKSTDASHVTPRVGVAEGAIEAGALGDGCTDRVAEGAGGVGT